VLQSHCCCGWFAVVCPASSAPLRCCLMLGSASGFAPRLVRLPVIAITIVIVSWQRMWFLEEMERDIRFSSLDGSSPGQASSQKLIPARPCHLGRLFSGLPEQR